MNPYASLMAQQGGAQPMRATPVHHENNPAYLKLMEAMKGLDTSLDQMPATDPTMDEQIQVRDAMARKAANIEAAHKMIENRRLGREATRQGQALINNPDIEMLERGLAPGR